MDFSTMMKIEEIDEIDENYSFKEFQTDSTMNCVDSVSEFMDIVEISMEDAMKTEISSQNEFQIDSMVDCIDSVSPFMDIVDISVEDAMKAAEASSQISENNSTYLSSNDQWNATTESDIKINDILLPCSYICETSLNEIALSHENYFETNSHNSLFDIDSMDLDLLLGDNVIQDINSCSMNDVSKMSLTTSHTTSESKETSELCEVKNDSIRKHLLVSIMNKLKRNKKCQQLQSKNKSFESNDTYILNNMLEPQFTIFDDLNSLRYLPLPAMQLIFYKEYKEIIKIEDYNNKRNKKSVKKGKLDVKKKRKGQPSSPNNVKTKNSKVNKKIECEYNEKVLSNLPPIIPVPVVHYMNLIQSERSTQHLINTKQFNKLINDW